MDAVRAKLRRAILYMERNPKLIRSNHLFPLYRQLTLMQNWYKYLVSPRDETTPATIAFWGGLRRGGFIEGQNLTVEYRVYGQHFELIPQYAAELVMAGVDVIATSGDETVRALQQATKTVPIVALVGVMLGSGLVASLARPDGNATGVSILAREADGKRQDILIEAVPGIRVMAVLFDINAAKLDARR